MNGDCEGEWTNLDLSMVAKAWLMLRDNGDCRIKEEYLFSCLPSFFLFFFLFSFPLLCLLVYCRLLFARSRKPSFASGAGFPSPFLFTVNLSRITHPSQSFTVSLHFLLKPAGQHFYDIECFCASIHLICKNARPCPRPGG